MAARLTKEGDKLLLKLGGHPAFHEALARTKQIPGRRYNPDTKDWEFPAEPKLAQRIMHTINPQPDAAILGWLREGALEVAEELAGKLPADSDALIWERAGDLWPFQRSAVEFGVNVERLLIADDMGLGKTIEGIGIVQEYLRRLQQKQEAHAVLPKLVVAGTSKLGDWRDELAKWAPGEPTMVVPGDHRPGRRKKMLLEFGRDYAPEGGWLIVNHEQLRAAETNGKGRKNNWAPREPWFAEQEWLARIGDEAHRWKNRNAQQTGGMMQLASRLTVLLTGTPIMNSPDELWALLAIIRPDLYAEWSSSKVTYWQFLHTYVESYAIEGRGLVITGAKNTDELRFELADKMVRRTKRLLREKGLLPTKLPTKMRSVTMRPAQQALYQKAANELWLQIERDIEELEPEQRARIDHQLERGDGLEALIRFLPNAAAKYAVQKQIATSPALVGAPDDSGKLNAVVEDVLDHPGKQFVVFTWHKKAAELVAIRLAKKKVRAEVIHGDVAQLERTEIVRRFQSGDTQILVATIKAGGEGLNLTATDTALFVERSERVTDNDQAEDRLHRLGQTSDVTVVVYQSENTIEDGSQDARLRMKEIIIGAAIGRDREAV